MGRKSQVGIETLSPKQAAILTRMRPQTVRLGLQQGRLDFGVAVQKPNR